MTDFLKPDSLEWALAHLLRYGDTDLLPIPFEYRAIKSDWSQLRPLLERRDLSLPQPGALDHFLVPKPEGSFRVVTRLDPLDAILYTAAIYDCSLLVEKARAPTTIACSYRIDPDPAGRLFAAENAWDAWTEQSAMFLQRDDTTHVVRADISDFYSQIGHHRVCNALETAGVSLERAQAIEKMLGSWSALQSRGIPVGPHASIVLAEACLIDVDQHLVGHGFQHVRYVDDFRIFCRSRAEAVKAVHDLCDYLFTSHRLALAPHKTRTYTKEAFTSQFLEQPEFIERQAKTRRIESAVQAAHAAGYAVSTDDVTVSHLDVAVLGELFEECVKSTPLRLGLARYLFRRAGALGTTKLVQPTLDNLDTLTPILRDAIVYLTKVKSKRLTIAARPQDRLLWFGVESDYSFLPLVHEWTIEAMTTAFAGLLSDADLRKLARPASGASGLRGEALLAKARNDVAWVRGYKERWRAAGSWDRRAIIWAGSVLPADERSAWKKAIMASSDPIDRAVAITALRVEATK